MAPHGRPADRIPAGPEGRHMGLNWFTNKDPVCGMPERKGEGLKDGATGKWFCSEGCRDQYAKAKAKAQKAGGCCAPRR